MVHERTEAALNVLNAEGPVRQNGYVGQLMGDVKIS